MKDEGPKIPSVIELDRSLRYIVAALLEMQVVLYDLAESQPNEVAHRLTGQLDTVTKLIGGALNAHSGQSDG